VNVFRALRVRISVGRSFTSSFIIFVRGIHLAMNPARFTVKANESIFLVLRFFMSVLDEIFLFSMGKIMNATVVQ